MQIPDDVKLQIRQSFEDKLKIEISKLSECLLHSYKKDSLDLDDYETMDRLVFLGMLLLGLQNADAPGQTKNNNVYLRLEQLVFDIFVMLVVRYR